MTPQPVETLEDAKEVWEVTRVVGDDEACAQPPSPRPDEVDHPYVWGVSRVCTTCSLLSLLCTHHGWWCMFFAHYSLSVQRGTDTC